MGKKEKEKKTEKKEEERLNDGNNNGQLRIANVTSGGGRKAAWANFVLLCVISCSLHSSTKYIYMRIEDFDSYFNQYSFPSFWEATKTLDLLWGHKALSWAT